MIGCFLVFLTLVKEVFFLSRGRSGKRKWSDVSSIAHGKAYVNIGLTKSPKRGHHKNVKIHNPQDWSRDSYLRDDVRIDSKEYLREVLKDYKLCPEDIYKIWAIINKKDSH